MTSGMIQAFVKMAMRHNNLPRLSLKRKSPFSLQSLCLEQVAEILGCAWSEAQTNDPYVRETLEEVVQYLRIPSSFADEILHILACRRSVHAGHLVVLLSKGLKTIQLEAENSSIQWLDVVGLASSDALQNVSCLDVSGRIEHIPSAILQTILPLFTGVREMHLPYTVCNDTCLRAIAKHCIQIRLLDLTRCPITDSGLDSLHPPDHVPFLERLCLRRTKVTCMGAAILLSRIPLQELVVDNMAAALITVHAHRLADGCVESVTNTLECLRVIRIDFHDASCQRRRGAYEDVEVSLKLDLCFGAVVAHCRNVERLLVFHAPLPSVDLTSCESLSHLELHFRSCEDFTELRRSLGNGQVGKRLFELALTHVENLTISGLCDMVPHLQVLTLKNVTGNVYANRGGEASSAEGLHALQKLSVNNAPASLVLGLVGVTHSLETVAVANVSEFEPADLQLLGNHFRSSTRRLSFCDCDGITALRVERMLPDLKVLEHLNVYGNATLLSKMEDLKHRLEKANIDLRVTMKNIERFGDLTKKIYSSYDFN